MNVPIEAIIENVRIREDYGDLSDLKESLETVGLLQPIGVREVGEKLEVIWGGRRLRAAKELGWLEIEAKVLKCDEDYDMREMELEENIRRKDMTWQEQVASLYEIHRLKKMRNAKIGEKWGFRETGKLLGVALGSVSYSIEVAKYLRSGDAEIKSAATLTDAIRILTKRKEAELLKKKFAATADKKEGQFFSAKDIEELKKAKEASTNRVMYVSRVGASNYVVTGYGEDPRKELFLEGHLHFWPLHDPVAMYAVLEWRRERNGAEYFQHYVLQDLSAQNPGLPLKDQIYVASLMARKVPVGQRNEPAYMAGNCFVERDGGKQPYAVDRKFIYKAAEFLIPMGSVVKVVTACPTYAVALALAGYKCIVEDQKTYEAVLKGLEPYGKIQGF